MNRLILVGVIVVAMGCGGGKGDKNGGTGGSSTGAAGSMGSAGSTGAGGTGACVMGQEGCACYGNDTCDANLQCFSHLCVAATGTGGSVTGTGGSGPGTGGSGPGSGGTTGAGGSAACPTGSEGCACYGNSTCNSNLQCLSHLCVSATGTGGSGPGTGGSGPGTGGSAAGTGGSGTGRGGTTGTGGSGSGGTNGNTLSFTSGVVPPGSNTFGIAGPIYTFSDGAGSTITPNCTTDTCFSDLNGPGAACVSGTGVTVGLNSAGTDYDYSTYWGAAMQLDLNNPTYAAMAQQAYVASAHGVTGFQFTFQNKASSTVRLVYKIRDTSSNTVVDYCLDLKTATSVIHFSDVHQSCYLSPPGPALTPALADHLEEISWQVPTTPAGPTAFSFCVANLTPLTQ